MPRQAAKKKKDKKTEAVLAKTMAVSVKANPVRNSSEIFKSSQKVSKTATHTVKRQNFISNGTKQKPEKAKIPAIKKFIDFFNTASFKIRKVKPVFTHGKDGMLVKHALKKLTLSQMEQLALWFLEKKKTLSPTIGAMLSKKVLETLKKDMERNDFFREVNALHDGYYKSVGYSAVLAEKFRPFDSRQITEMQEQIARFERLVKRGIY